MTVECRDGKYPLYFIDRDETAWVDAQTYIDHADEIAQSLQRGLAARDHQIENLTAQCLALQAQLLDIQAVAFKKHTNAVDTMIRYPAHI